MDSSDSKNQISEQVRLKKVLTCKFPGCNVGYYGNWKKLGKGNEKQPSFYRFPQDYKLRTLWNIVCNIEGSLSKPNYRICENHFAESDFLSPNISIYKFRILNDSAIPKPSSKVLEINSNAKEGASNFLGKEKRSDIEVPPPIERVNALFEPKINNWILDHLKSEFNLKPLKKYSLLLFNVFKLSNNTFYDFHTQQILKKNAFPKSVQNEQRVEADHVLVFMLVDIKTSSRQVVAYYFTEKVTSTLHLRGTITLVIRQLQDVGIEIVATVCHEWSVNIAALSELRRKNGNSLNIFEVGDKEIAIIFDVPHLLKATRNAMLQFNIQFDNYKLAKFEHINRVFEIDHQKRFPSLYKLAPNDFNFEDDDVRNNVAVAAHQLSHTMASNMETYACAHEDNLLPMEALQTAEFAHDIDQLFDSLNGSSLPDHEHKQLRCPLSTESPHLVYWRDALEKLSKWKPRDKSNRVELTAQYHLVELVDGWKTTIRSVMHVWEHLQLAGFKELNLRTFNLEPLEDLLSQIRKNNIEMEYFNKILNGPTNAKTS